MFRIFGILLVGIIALPSFASNQATPPSINIPSGRMIQKDGFLIEWPSKNLKPWNHGSRLGWDALTTVEGVAGYIQITPFNIDERWQVIAYVEQGPVFTWILDSTLTSGTSYAVATTQSLGTTTATIEFIIPWNGIVVQPDSTFRLALIAVAPGGDTLAPIYLSGSRKEAQKKGTWNSVYFQSGAIAILLLIYLVMRIRLRPKTRRTESPRQSA